MKRAFFSREAFVHGLTLGLMIVLCLGAADMYQSRGSGSPITSGAAPYGSMRITAGATPLGITVIDTFAQVTGFSAGDLNGVTFASDELTVPTTDVYRVACHATAGPAATATMRMAVAVNGTTDLDTEIENLALSAALPGSASLSALLSLTAGDDITLEIANGFGPGDMTVTSATCVVSLP